MRHHRTLRGIAGGLACVLGLTGLIATLPAARAAEQVTVEGVLHMRNGTTPSQSGETLRLVEKWRVGGEESDDVLLGLVTQVLRDDNGDYYVLDLQLSHVEVFDAGGKHLRTLSREGEGPGEVRQPVDLVFTPDGKLGMVQSFPGKVIKIDREGNPAGDIGFGGSDPSQGNVIALSQVHRSGDGYVIAGTDIAFSPSGNQTRKSFLASFDAAGKELQRYYEHETSFDVANLEIIEAKQYTVARHNWAVGPDGRVYYAPERDRYAIHVVKPDGAKDRVIERSFTAPKRTAEDLARVQSAMDAIKARIPLEVKTGVSETDQAISSMWFDGEGRLWVEHAGSGRDQAEGIMATYDVFDADGEFQRQVAVACSGNAREDGLRLFPEGGAVMITGLVDAALAMQGASGEGAEAKPLSVVCLEAVR